MGQARPLLAVYVRQAGIGGFLDWQESGGIGPDHIFRMERMFDAVADPGVAAPAVLAEQLEAQRRAAEAEHPRHVYRCPESCSRSQIDPLLHLGQIA